MYKVKLLNSISDKVYTNITPEQVVEDIADAQAIIVRSANMHEMDLPDGLLAIARAGAGVNNIPLDKCSEKGIFVFNTPGANANAVKELTLLAMLLAARHAYEGMIWCESLKGDADAPKKVESGKKAFVGNELFGKTIGIVGYGSIGSKVGEMALALGMKVLIYARRTNSQIEKHQQMGATLLPKEEVFKNADYISLHLPLSSTTKGFIDSDAIDLMKDGAKIINLARGELVDDNALLEGLESGKIACYVTDFPNGNIIGKKGVLAIPHLGASTVESEENCAAMASAEINEFMTSGNSINSVNFPNLTVENKGKYRYTLLVKEEVETETKEQLGRLGVKYEYSTNKGYTYFICDSDTPVELNVKAVAQRVITD